MEALDLTPTDSVGPSPLSSAVVGGGALSPPSPASSVRVRSLAPITRIADALTPHEKVEANLRKKCPEIEGGSLASGKAGRRIMFPEKILEGGTSVRKWPLAKKHQTRHYAVIRGRSGYFLKPYNALQLKGRKYSPNNMWPGESFPDRVAQLLAGKQPIEHGPHKE